MTDPYILRSLQVEVLAFLKIYTTMDFSLNLQLNLR